MKHSLALALGLAVLPAPVLAQAAWTQLNPTTVPARRGGPVCVSDHNVLLFFGGNENATTFPTDTWQFDGTDWSLLNPATTSPPGRRWHSAAYDHNRGRMVVFGGQGRNATGNYELGDTWEWTGTDWVQFAPAIAPGARRWTAMAYDDQRNVCILFGGYDGTTYNNETWSWDGAAWTLLSPTTSPSARGRGKMSYDQKTGEMVYFGGRDAGGVIGETWIWDGSDWSQATTATVPNTNGIFAGAMTYDEVRERHVHFGGTTSGPTLAQTWDFDGSDWTRRSDLPAAGRTGPGLAFVRNLGKTFVFGGFSTTQLDETWEYQTDAIATFAEDAGSPGCPDSNAQTASLVAQSMPWTDDTFILDVTNVTVNDAVAMAVDFTPPVVVDLSGIGAPGCTLYAGMPLVFPAGAGPVGNFQLPIPDMATIGHTSRIIGTPTSTTRISSGRPIRQ